MSRSAAIRGEEGEERKRTPIGHVLLSTRLTILFSFVETVVRIVVRGDDGYMVSHVLQRASDADNQLLSSTF